MIKTKWGQWNFLLSFAWLTLALIILIIGLLHLGKKLFPPLQKLNPQKALEVWKKNPENPENAIRLARYYYQQFQFFEANSENQKKIFNGFKTHPLLSIKKKTNQRQGKAFQRYAIQLYRIARALDGKEIPEEDYFRLGMLLIEKNSRQNPEATRLLQRASQSGHSVGTSEFFLGNIAYREGKITSARDHYLRSLERMQNQPVILFNLGWVYKELKNWPRASWCFQKSLKEILKKEQLEEDSVEQILETRFLLGWIYIRQGKGKEAIEELQKAALAQPLNLDIHYFLARAHEISGDKKQAKKEYEFCIKKKKNFRDAKKRLSTL